MNNQLQKDIPIVFLFEVKAIATSNDIRDNENAKDILNYTEMMKPPHMRANNDSQSQMDPNQEKLQKEEEEMKNKIENLKWSMKVNLEELKIQLKLDIDIDRLLASRSTGPEQAVINLHRERKSRVEQQSKVNDKLRSQLNDLNDAIDDEEQKLN